MLHQDNQVLLTDFFSFPVDSPPSEHMLWDKFRKLSLYIDRKGTVHIKAPFCPHCGRREYTQDGTSLKRTHDILENRFYFVCQRYYCKRCGKAYSAHIKNIIVYDEQMVQEKIIARVNANIEKMVVDRGEMFDLGNKIKSLLDDVLYNHISLQMSPQAHYDKDEIIDLSVRSSINTTFMETTRNLLDIGPDLVEYPSADTVLLYIGKKKLKEIRHEFRVIFQRLLNKYRENRMLSEPVEIAVDLHDKEYYGKQRTGEVRRSKAKNGTTYFHKYLTVDCVGDRESFTLTAEHVSMFDDAFKVCNDSLDFVRKNGIDIKRAYLDREFFNPKIIDELMENKTPFVIPAVKNDKVWRLANEHWNQAKYVFPYQFGKGKEKFTIFIVPNPKYDQNKKAGKTKNPKFFVFATNIPIKKTDHQAEPMEDSDRTSGIEREELAESYSSRWGIETDYRVLEHEFMSKTTSNKFNIRYYYFMLGTVLRNVWVISQSLFKDEYQDKFPKKTMTAKQWSKVLERSMDKYEILRSLRSWFDEIQSGLAILG